MNLTAALTATAYLPSAAGTTELLTAPPTKPPAQTVALEREEDPLPYADLKPSAAPKLPVTVQSAPASEPLPLDDEPAAPTTTGPLPFRTPARVTADTDQQFTGPCAVVFAPHGLFLEAVQFRPFLYAPVGSQVARPAGKSLAIALLNGRSVTVEFLGRDAGQIADDAAAFLSAERPVPVASEYRHSPVWLLGLALTFALGLAIAPIATAPRVGANLATGLLLGAGFAVAGLLLNAFVALFTRLPVPGKVAVMAASSATMTGVFLLVALAYLTGRQHAEAPAPPIEPPPAVPKPPGSPGETPGDPPRSSLPTAIDLAYRDGVYRFEDGPDAVTALAYHTDTAALVVGYKDGSTRVWRLDQPTIEPHAIGPRCDGAPTRIAFDTSGAIVYMTTAGGTVGALWNDPPDVPVKVPGEQFVAFPHPNGERFATRRGNAIALRYVPTNLIKKPAGKAKGFLLTLPKDETLPADVKAQFVTPPRMTFLAWHPTGVLLGGQPDGTVLTWGATGPTFSIASREHKAAVRAWASAPNTWDFATGDDKGVVGLWANKSMTPRTFPGATGAVTQLAFSPSGTLLAVGDAAGAVRVWDLAVNRAIARLTRVAPQTAFGPNDDTLLFSDGKAVELWSLPELMKQP